MARRKTLTDSMVAALKPESKPNPLPDPELPGHYVRIGRVGKTFVAVSRAPSGKQAWHTIGASTLYTIAESRDKAREAIKAMRGVGGVYDRHNYRDEKAFALNALASLIDSIVNPRPLPSLLRRT